VLLFLNFCSSCNVALCELLLCIVVFLALLLMLPLSHCSSYIIPFTLLLLHYSSCVAPNATALLVLLLVHYCSFLTTTGLLHYYFSHIALLTLPLLSRCYSPHIILTLSFLLCFKYLLAQPLLLLYFVWLIWYFPYPYHVQVEAQSFDTNLNTIGIFSIFLNFFLLFFVIATLMFMPHYFFVHFVLFLFIM
jgi:hypothetical protein